MIPKLNRLSRTQAHYLEFLQALQKTDFSGDINPDYANRMVLATDNSIYQVLPQGVVYPQTTQDIINLCELANQSKYHDIVLSPRGGGTGTNGQSLTDGIVVDLSKHMNRILEVNAEQGWVRVETGVVKDQLNAALLPHGLFFAPDLSTSNRATIGGMINTDASGQGSCVYGKTRDHVLQLKTVLLDGSTVVSQALSAEEFACEAEQQNRSGLIHRLLNSIQKDHADLIEQTFPKLNRCMTGYDLAHIRDNDNHFNLNNILCGSEGTLGFITEAKLNVIPLPKCVALVVVKYSDFDSSLRDATALMHAGPTSIETIDSKVLNLAMNDFIWNQVEEFFAEESTVPVQGINLVEYTAENDVALQEKIDKLIQEIKVESKGSHNRIGYALASGKDAVNRIWAMRKRAVGLLGNAEGEARPIAFVEDTAVPPEHLADFILEFREILDAYNLSYGMFGHVDAGVLHVRPALDMKDPEQANIAWEISDRIADLTHQYKGVLWGEHGKGVRSQYAPLFFGELYPQLQRIKASFDPHNQLNPGKIATPDAKIQLLKIHEVSTRGDSDKQIQKENWKKYQDAVYCNGNGACYNWNYDDPMCPSWKATRERIHSPKGRASLIKEWLKQVSLSESKPLEQIYNKNGLKQLFDIPVKFWNSAKKTKGDYDFSNEVYNSMAGCLACKSCAGQCPIKVNVPEFRSQFLAAYHTRYLRPLKDYLVGALEFLLPWCAKVAPLYNTIMHFSPVQRFLEHVVGFVHGPKLTGVKLNTHDIQFASESVLSNLSAEERDRTLIIVQDAFTSYFETQLVIDTYKLMQKLGFNPLIAPYKANGKPLHVHGFLKIFNKVAEKNASMLNAFEEHNVSLVGIDPSMTLTYRSEYRKYLTTQRAPNIKLIQEWLVENIEKIDVQTPNHEHLNNISYSLLPHCTEKTNATASVHHWQKIFSKLNLALTAEQVGCCGMSGTYGHETRNKENSAKIYQQSWQKHIEKPKNDLTYIATGYSCRSQVKLQSNKKILHPVQALLAHLLNIDENPK